MELMVEIATISLTSAEFLLNNLSPLVYKFMWMILHNSLLLRHFPECVDFSVSMTMMESAGFFFFENVKLWAEFKSL